LRQAALDRCLRLGALGYLQRRVQIRYNPGYSLPACGAIRDARRAVAVEISRISPPPCVQFFQERETLASACMRFIGAWFEAVYGLVAANRRFVAGPAGRVFWLKTAVILAFCIGLSMSSHLWVGPRSYPAIPVFTLLPAIDGFVADCLFAAIFVLSAAILIAPKPRRLIAALLAITVVFCLLDQTRWQPWVFQYSILLAMLALFSWKSDDTAGQQRTLNIARLVIASTYVLSGLQKLNSNFIDVDFPWVVGPITKAFRFR
jgi:hypothetical protein